MQGQKLNTSISKNVIKYTILYTKIYFYLVFYSSIKETNCCKSCSIFSFLSLTAFFKYNAQDGGHTVFNSTIDTCRQN